jgi:hypothetical protein
VGITVRSGFTRHIEIIGRSIEEHKHFFPQHFPVGMTRQKKIYKHFYSEGQEEI